MRLLALLDARATDIYGWDSFHLDPTDPEEPVYWGTTLTKHLPGRESVSVARDGIEREQRDWDQAHRRPGRRRTVLRDHLGRDARGMTDEVTGEGQGRATGDRRQWDGRIRRTMSQEVPA
jgi:hypothetical protein